MAACTCFHHKRLQVLVGSIQEELSTRIESERKDRKGLGIARYDTFDPYNESHMAPNNDPSTKRKSVLLCEDCDGNGAILCSQCKGTGGISIDYFNGQFNAGDSCWLCE